jgi:hypothetical protein
MILGIEVIYAKSPAAKGKIERPYRWIQDHLTRTCVRDSITTIDQAREVLSDGSHSILVSRPSGGTTKRQNRGYQKSALLKVS